MDGRPDERKTVRIRSWTDAESIKAFLTDCCKQENGYLYL